MIVFVSFITSMYILRRDASMGFIEFIDLSLGHVLIFFVLSLIFALIFMYNGLYRVNIMITRASHLTSIIKSLYYGALNVVLVSLLISTSEIVHSRLIIFVFLLIVIPALYFFRVEMLRAIFLQLSKTTGYRRNVVILGNGKNGKMLATKLLYENPIGLNILGFVDEDKEIGEEIVGGKKVLSHLDELEQIVYRYDVDEIIIALDGVAYETLFEIIDNCKKLNVSTRLTSEVFDIIPKKISTEKYFDIPVVDVSPHYNNAITISMKRVFDVSLSIFALIALFPLMVTIVLLIKLTSPGKVLFKQKRIGRYGKEFDFYKFRSMKESKGEDEKRKEMMIEFMKQGSNDVDTKIINEDRITWIGKIIRKTSLDELPQLFNVIKGEMSLVGPRPSLPYEYHNYDNWQKRRVAVTPGCTGVWQVWGRSAVSFKDSIVMDLYYINNMSPWMDLQLIFQTIPAILTFRGAK